MKHTLSTYSLNGNIIDVGEIIDSSDFIDASSGASDEGKVPKLNEDGELDVSFFPQSPIIRTYSTSGSPHTWTKPVGLKYIIAEIVGGGGGGEAGESPSSGSEDSGGGGGGAGYCKKIIPASSLGSTETITIGSGGSGNGSSERGDGSNGNNSTFGSFLTASGGSGGTASGGSGGTASGGDVNIPGEKGKAGRYESVGGNGGVTPLVTHGKGGDGGNVAVSWSGSDGNGGYCIVTEFYI